jgi:hypothetical protein
MHYFEEASICLYNDGKKKVYIFSLMLVTGRVFSHTNSISHTTAMELLGIICDLGWSLMDDHVYFMLR